jgi:hypothetical protein
MVVLRFRELQFHEDCVHVLLDGVSMKSLTSDTLLFNR